MENELLKDVFHFEQEGKERLDTCLSKRFSNYSRSYFQRLIEKKNVRINGNIVKKGHFIKKNDRIEVIFTFPQLLDLIPQAIPLEILYEDEDLICVNKPAGMVVYPAPGHPSQTFANALAFHCSQNQLPGLASRPGIVHRLDKETSGILVGAKTYEAYQNLIEQFSSRKIEKTYLAITVGNPNVSIINVPIGRNPRKREQMSLLKEGGKEAITEIFLLQKTAYFSLIKAKLITGRTHQIRVHLRSQNAPILGDSLYGFSQINDKFQISRQMLHAWKIFLIHPVKKTPLHLTAPFPCDFSHCLKKFFTHIEDIT